MSRLRSIPTRRLLMLVAAVAAVAVAGTTLALAATGGAPRPPASTLRAALAHAVGSKPVAGITARVRFTNRLIDSSSIQGADPILTGGGGRIWASADGHVRVELQADGGNGDAQLTWDGRRLTVFDPAANTVYRLDAHSRGVGDESHAPPSPGRIDELLGRVRKRADLSGAQPTNVAGRPAYEVRVSPRRDGGLLGGVKLAWDAATGVPLRIGVYAAGTSEAVLQLEATDISYGHVSPDDLRVEPPADAKVVDLSAPGDRSGDRAKAVTGKAAVQRAVGFPVAAPDALVGLPRTDTRLIRSSGDAGALSVYGKGLGAIVVVQTPAARHTQTPAGLPLPRVSINGTTGQELDTALGTVIRFTRGGVDYVVAGSVPPAAAEAAARAL